MLLALVIWMGACGSPEKTGSAPKKTTTVKAKAQAEPPAENLSDSNRTPAEEAQLEKEYADVGRWKALKKAAGDKAGRLIIPIGPPPEEIEIRDLRVGKGAKLDVDDQYLLESLAFDYSEAHLGEDTFGGEGSWWTFGTGEAIDAREIGLKGMRAGGMRELVVPASVLHDDDAAVYLMRLKEVAKE